MSCQARQFGGMSSHLAFAEYLTAVGEEKSGPPTERIISATAIASPWDRACPGSRLALQSAVLALRRIGRMGSAELLHAESSGKRQGIAMGCLRLPQPRP